MKRLYSILMVLLAVNFAVNANALYVAVGGNCPACTLPIYPTIQSAVTAANSGDTIFIRNQTGDAPYIENVSIPANKALDIAPYVNDSVFYCEGTWTITGTAGYTINIVGMYNINGSISATASAVGGSTTNRCRVRLIGGQMGTGTTSGANSGFINFNYSYYDLVVYGMKVMGATSSQPCIEFAHGTIVGDSIVQAATNSYAIAAYNDGLASTDTSFIQGNIIWQSSTGGQAAIYWACNTSFFDIRNNLIYNSDASGSSTKGIYINNVLNALLNKIHNNTIDYNSSTSIVLYGIYVASGAGTGIVEIQNNCITSNGAVSSGTAGIYNNNGANTTVNAYYNFVNDVTNFTTTGGTMAVSTGNAVATSVITLGTGASLTPYPISSTFPPASAAAATTSLGYYINTVNFGSGAGTFTVGNPGLMYQNVGNSSNVLTQNVPGCYGGSFTLSNYYPMNMNYGPTHTWATSIGQGNIYYGGLGVQATSVDR